MASIESALQQALDALNRSPNAQLSPLLDALTSQTFDDTLVDTALELRCRTHRPSFIGQRATLKSVMARELATQVAKRWQCL